MKRLFARRGRKEILHCVDFGHGLVFDVQRDAFAVWVHLYDSDTLQVELDLPRLAALGGKDLEDSLSVALLAHE